MKTFRKEIILEIPSRCGFVNITPQVEAALHESGIQEGMLLCNPMHITASVFINDDEKGLHHDYDNWLEKLALLMNPSQATATTIREKTMPMPI